MTYDHRYTFATDPFLSERFSVAVTYLATAALAAGRPDSSRMDGDERAAALARYGFASRALGARNEAARAQWAVAVSEHPAAVDALAAYSEELSPTDVTDEALHAAVAAVWDALAGA